MLMARGVERLLINPATLVGVIIKGSARPILLGFALSAIPSKQSSQSVHTVPVVQQPAYRRVDRMQYGVAL